MSTPVIGLTMGDPAGIGPEITVAALADPAVRTMVRPLLVADARVIERSIASAGLDLRVNRVAGPEEIGTDPTVVDVLDLDNVG
jgi:4-phospho-D-threonate 3-dehydrogenase / 4-phospho-D-erythronate 3-dehydrogenase